MCRWNPSVAFLYNNEKNDAFLSHKQNHIPLHHIYGKQTTSPYTTLRKSGWKTLHYWNSVILLVHSREHDMWKNTVNRRVRRSYHTTLRTWMSHFVPPAVRLWIFGIIIMFYLNKPPQILPMSSVLVFFVFFFFSFWGFGSWVIIRARCFYIIHS